MPSYRLWHPPVSTSLADVTGHLVDVAQAKAYLQKFQEISLLKERDNTLAEALLAAAVIRYCRCFTTGNRSRLTIEQLSTATPSEITLHKQMQGVRDWHIAHPINRQEVHAVHIIVDESPEATSLIQGLSSFSAVSMPLSAQHAKDAIELCSKWLRLLQDELVQEQLRLKPYADRMNREQILALPIEDPAPSKNINSRRAQAPRR